MPTLPTGNVLGAYQESFRPHRTIRAGHRTLGVGGDVVPPPVGAGLTAILWISPRMPGNYVDASGLQQAAQGDHVLKTQDYSGSGNSPTQASTNKGPTLRDGYWEFDGNDDNWLTPAISAQAQPILVAAKVWIPGNPSSVAFIVGGAAGAPRLRIETNGNASVNAGSTVTVGSQTAGAWHTIICYFNGASSFALFDGVNTGVINPGSGGYGAGVLAIGASSAGNANLFQGYMKDAIIQVGTAVDPAGATSRLNTWYSTI